MKHIRLLPHPVSLLLSGNPGRLQKVTNEGGYTASGNSSESTQILDEELMAPEDIQKRIEIDSASGGKRLANVNIDRVMLYVFFM